MKRTSSIVIFCLLLLGTTVCTEIGRADGNTTQRKVVTALDHLTVLEYEEPVAQAAVGSSQFQIERQENKVFIKPLKSNVSTNLFVWTVSGQQYSYELSVADVPNMDAIIHSAGSKPTTSKDDSTKSEQMVVTAVTRTLLGVQSVDRKGLKVPKHGMFLRIDNVYRDQGNLFIRYALENHAARTFHVIPPNLYQLQADHADIDLVTLRDTQLDSRTLERLGDAKKLQLTCSNNSTATDIPPGHSSEGLISVPQRDWSSPTVLQVVFTTGVEATLVL